MARKIEMPQKSKWSLFLKVEKTDSGWHVWHWIGEGPEGEPETFPDAKSAHGAASSWLHSTAERGDTITLRFAGKDALGHTDDHDTRSDSHAAVDWLGVKMGIHR